MTRLFKSKYAVFALILVVGVALDQWTKWYASQRLATYRPGHVEHTLTLTAPEDAHKLTVRELLEQEFTSNSPEEIDGIARAHIRAPNGDLFEPGDQLAPGDKVVVEHRSVTVIDGYWEFEYTVNPGAAFGLLSESSSQYRLPFFIVVSLLAVVVILYILRGVHDDQKLLIVALSLIGTGALGNFIDRIRFGHVIDFIVWKYGEQFRWPTFNVADACITVGVALMLFEIFFGGPYDDEEPFAQPADSESDESES
ncbi:MAG: signal peptidase II [Bradymonadaceae bacterium]